VEYDPRQLVSGSRNGLGFTKFSADAPEEFTRIVFRVVQ
jgi:hypothetical protein